MEAVGKANKYVSDTKPWELVKDPEGSGRLDTVLRNCVQALRTTSILLDPVIPTKAAELRQQLGLADVEITFEAAGDWEAMGAGFSTNPGEPLFPRVDLEALRAEITAVDEPEPAAGGNEAMEHKPAITIDEFARMELRVATIMSAEPHPKADRLMVLQVRLGNEARQIVSGIREHYEAADLTGKKVVVVANLPAVKLRGIESQGMILAASDAAGNLSVIGLDRDLPDGSEVT